MREVSVRGVHGELLSKADRFDALVVEVVVSCDGKVCVVDRQLTAGEPQVREVAALASLSERSEFGPDR